MKEKIIKYYLLCTVGLGKKSHIVSEIPEKKLHIVLTKKEINLFLRKQDGNYIARDIVVGGSPQERERLPVIVI